MYPLVKFEIGNLLRAPAFWMFAVTCLLFGIMVPVDEMGPGMQTLNLGAPYRFQFFILCAALLCPVGVMICFPLSFHRDLTHQFEGLTAGASWRKRFWPKWWSVFVCVLGGLSLVPVGILLGLALVSTQPQNWVLLVFGSVVPGWLGFLALNTWVVMAVMVAVYYRWRNSVSAYLAATGLVLVFWSCQVLIGTPIFGISPIIEKSRWLVASVVDPFGLSTYFHATQYWTVAQKNTQSMPITKAMLINRIVWGVVSLMCLRLAVACAAKPPVRFSKRKKQAAVEKLVVENYRFQSVVPTSGFLALARFEIGCLWRSWAFRLSLLAWLGLSSLGLLMVKAVFSDGVSPRLPSASVILSYSGEPFFFFGLLMALVFTNIILWREKQAGTLQIINAMPVQNKSLMLAKLLALLLVGFSQVAVMIGVGISYQALVGYRPISFGHWFGAFYHFGWPLMVHGTYIFLVQALAYSKSWNRLTALGGSGLVVLSINILPRFLHIEQPFFRLFSFPNLLRRHSDMRGYSTWGELFHHLSLVWCLALVPILVCLWKIWPRIEQKIPYRQSLLYGGLSVFLMSVGFSAYQFQAAQTFSPSQELKARATYEKRFSAGSADKVPQMVHTSNQIELFPEQRMVTISSTNDVVNTTGKPLDRLLITAPNPLKRLTFSIPHKILFHDPVINAVLVAFEQPWSPNQKQIFRYETMMVSNRFSINEGLDHEASYFLQAHFEPVLGYYQGLEIKDPQQRALLELPQKTFKRQDRHTGYGRFVKNKRTFDVRFSTAGDQTPLTSGELVASENTNGRTVHRYVSEKPIYPVIGYFSAAYQQLHFNTGALPVTVYYHQGHDKNLSLIQESVRAAVTYCEEHFGPYPYSNLSLIEIPGTFPTGGRASAGVVALNELGLFMLDPDPGNSVHTVVRRTVHEVVHQWFGEKLVPKISNGERVLNESLTKYVEAMIVQRMLGPDMVRTINKASQHRYLSGRSRDAEEVGLVEANAYYLCYGKGALAFQVLKDVFGEGELNHHLKTFINEHQGGMTATMSQLAEHLLAAADETQKPVVREWLFGKKVFDFKWITARVEKQGKLNWLEMELSASVHKLDSPSSSNSSINQWLTVGWFDRDPRHGLPELFEQKTIKVNSNQTTVRIAISKVPRYLLIDPLVTQLETNTQNNWFELKH